MEEGHTKKRRRLEDDQEAGMKRKKKKRRTEALPGEANEQPPQTNGVGDNTVKPSKKKKSTKPAREDAEPDSFDAPQTFVTDKPKKPKKKSLVEASYIPQDAATTAAMNPALYDFAPLDSTAAPTADKPKKKKKKDKARQAETGSQKEPPTMNGIESATEPAPADVFQEGPKTPKRKRSVLNTALETAPVDAERPKKKKKKHENVEIEPVAVEAVQSVQEGRATVPTNVPDSQEKPRKKRKKDRGTEATPSWKVSEPGPMGDPMTVDEPEPQPPAIEKRKKKKDRAKDIEPGEALAQSQGAQEAPSNAAEVNVPSSPPATGLAAYQTPRRKGPLTRREIGLKELHEQPSPVIKQTQCIWVPIWPKGFDEPVTAAIDQHLKPRLHRFDETLKGVLLSYENVCLNSKPTRKGGATKDTDLIHLLSTREYGVAYCWLIADLELFVPKRGAAMIGEIVLQNAGHIGVLCWGKFNASIEKKRLPRQWRWEDNDIRAASVDLGGDEDENHQEQDHTMRTLGSWMDENGEPVTGKVAFRIKNYDVGLSGDHAFLCIEGTMLSDKREAKLREEELKELQRLKAGKSPYLVMGGRQMPEFGFTDLGVDGEAKQEKERGWKRHGSRSGSRGGRESGRGSRASSKGPSDFQLIEADLES
jgi:DNA-directed RNA polymerase I subunit RPA43